VSGVPDILVRITEAVRARLGGSAPARDLEARAREASLRGVRRSLRAALGAPGVRVIAECKHRSPSRGWLRKDFDPVALARAYEAGGAAAISVVTEPDFFAGQAEWVAEVRGEVALPVMQKDFVLIPRQLFEAVLLGADAVLLIARILPGPMLSELLAQAGELGLEALVEVHDGEDLERALAMPAPLLGVNARDLRTFTVDLDAAVELASRVPRDRVAVLESGIGGPAELAALVGRGIRRFLIGEHLVRSPDPRAALSELVSWA
jgi:indole-3-glycerol phosphate synthase